MKNDNAITMTPSQVAELLKHEHKAASRRSILIESSPGIGKTQIAAQAAAALGVGFKALHAPLMQPEDYGMPVIYGAKKDSLKFVVSTEKFPLQNSNCPDSGILLLDEIAQTDFAGQKILANLVQEREIHGQKLKDGWTIVSTGNRAQDRAGANKILGHLGNRVTRVTLEVSLNDWTQWALQNNVKPELVSFIRFRPDLLNTYDAKQEINATPRAWVEGVSSRLGSLPSELEFPVFSGDVGQGPASELLAFLKVFRNLPNPDAVILNPTTAKVPKDPATQYAIVGSLVSRINEKNFGKAFEYIKRLPPEFSVLFAKDCVAKCPDVAATSDFISWASKDGASLVL